MQNSLTNVIKYKFIREKTAMRIFARLGNYGAFVSITNEKNNRELIAEAKRLLREMLEELNGR